jgi:hypothetical protein
VPAGVAWCLLMDVNAAMCVCPMSTEISGVDPPIHLL